MGETSHLVLVDLPDQVSACARLLGEIGTDADAIVVGGNGQSLLALQAQGIAARPSHLYWDWRGLKSWSEAVHRARLVEFWSEADALMACAAGQAYGRDFAPVFWRSLDLIYFFDTMVMKIKEIHDLAARLRPRVIHCGVAAPSVGAPLLTQGDSLYALVAPIVGRKLGIQVDPSLASESVRPTVPPQQANETRTLGALIWHAGRKLRGDLRQAMRDIRRERPQAGRQGKRACVVAVQDFMNHAPLEREVDVVRWLEGEPGPTIVGGPEPGITDSLVQAVCELPSFKRLCCYLDCDFSEVARSRLRAFLQEESLALYWRFGRACAKLSALRPLALLSNSMGSLHARAAAAAARHFRIPVILTPHGQIGDHKESIWRYFDLPHADHYVLFTPDARDYVERVFAPGAKLHWAGCTRQDDVLKPKPSRADICARYGLPGDGPLVIYVTVPPAGNFHRIGVTVANTRSFETSRRIVDAIRTNTTASIVVKGLPGDAPAHAPLMEHVVGLADRRLAYANDIGFVQFLDAADCLILDHPGYTVTEALTRRQKIFIFNETYDWEPEAIDLLREDAVFDTDLDAFLDKLATSLRDGSAFSGRRPSGAFLRKFVDPHCDGTASERFAGVVMEIIGGRQSVEPAAGVAR